MSAVIQLETMVVPSHAGKCKRQATGHEVISVAGDRIEVNERIVSSAHFTHASVSDSREDFVVARLCAPVSAR